MPRNRRGRGGETTEVREFVRVLVPCYKQVLLERQEVEVLVKDLHTVHAKTPDQQSYLGRAPLDL